MVGFVHRHVQYRGEKYIHYRRNRVLHIYASGFIAEFFLFNRGIIVVYLHPKSLEMMKSMRIVVDPKVTDFFYETRTWKDRLFTLPWRPWIRQIPHYCPRAYVLSSGMIAVSPRTKAILDSME